VPSETEPCEDPFADDTFVVRKDVRREDVDKERQVLHGADYNQSKTTTRHGRSAEQTRSIYSRCYTCQRCANWEASQHRVAFSGDTAWTLARGDRCVDPLSCSMPGSLADPPSSCRGSVDPTCGNKLENKHSTISVGVATYEGNHHEVPGCLS
jgi:hypothetical protein